MKKLISLAALAVIAAVAVPGSGAATGSTGPVLRAFCTTGPIRCQSALRVDLPERRVRIEPLRDVLRCADEVDLEPAAGKKRRAESLKS